MLSVVAVLTSHSSHCRRSPARLSATARLRQPFRGNKRQQPATQVSLAGETERCAGYLKDSTYSFVVNAVVTARCLFHGHSAVRPVGRTGSHLCARSGERNIRRADESRAQSLPRQESMPDAASRRHSSGREIDPEKITGSSRLICPRIARTLIHVTINV